MSVCYIELIGLKFGVEGVHFELNKFLDFSSPYVGPLLEIIYTKSVQKKHNVDKMFPPPPPSPSPLPLLLFLRGISFAAVLENASFRPCELCAGRIALARSPVRVGKD